MRSRKRAAEKRGSSGSFHLAATLCHLPQWFPRESEREKERKRVRTRVLS